MMEKEKGKGSGWQGKIFESFARTQNEKVVCGWLVGLLLDAHRLEIIHKKQKMSLSRESGCSLVGISVRLL